MKVKCEYCGNYLSDTDEKCPSCMAPNEHLKRVGNEVPQTIEELKTWYVEHNLPSEEVTRFFIGKDIREARAFGIYYDEKTGNYVVYKNKGTGERAVRYEGKDEAYAVNELYLKLKEEILHQKDLNHANNEASRFLIQTNASSYRRRLRRTAWATFLIFMVFALSLVVPLLLSLIDGSQYQKSGYYAYHDQPYYLYGTCLKSSSDTCEWYHYDPDSQKWSQAKNVNLKEVKYVGSDWHQYLGIDITNKLQDEDWFKEIHPPVPTSGYYQYNDQTYYYFYGVWYLYQGNSWSKSSAPSHDVEMNPSDYFDSSTTLDDPYGFGDTDYYRDYNSKSSSGSNWDSGSSYDSGSSWSSSSDDSWDSGSSWSSSDSWDSGGTDWDSDW